MPPFFGFLYKLLPFTLLLEVGAIYLSLFALLVGVFSAFYYLRLLVVLFYPERLRVLHKLFLLLSLRHIPWRFYFLFIAVNFFFLFFVSDLFGDTVVLSSVAVAILLRNRVS